MQWNLLPNLETTAEPGESGVREGLLSPFATWEVWGGAAVRPGNAQVCAEHGAGIRPLQL